MHLLLLLTLAASPKLQVTLPDAHTRALACLRMPKAKMVCIPLNEYLEHHDKGRVPRVEDAPSSEHLNEL